MGNTEIDPCRHEAVRLACDRGGGGQTFMKAHLRTTAVGLRTCMHNRVQPLWEAGCCSFVEPSRFGSAKNEGLHVGSTVENLLWTEN
jgi:hypothetical protein